jgi:hypothetical protein
MTAEVARSEHQREHRGEAQERQRPDDHYDLVAHRHATSPLADIVNFLKTNAGVDSPAVLSSPFILITIAYFGHTHGYVLDGPTSDRLRKWVLLANAKGRYSRGSSETLLDQDLTTVRESGEVSDLLDRLRNRVGRLDIVPAELAGRNQRSALFKTMFLAFRAAGAKDCNSSPLIALDHAGAQHKLQFHHIFPKAFLRRIGRSAREADDIANLAFIGGKTNRKILDKPPAEYLKPLMTEGSESSFAAQCIPTDDELLEATSYDRFLSVRRDLIAERLNLFLETSGLERGQDRVDPWLRELDEQISAVELRRCARWRTHFGAPRHYARPHERLRPALPKPPRTHPVRPAFGRSGHLRLDGQEQLREGQPGLGGRERGDGLRPAVEPGVQAGLRPHRAHPGLRSLIRSV